MKSIKIILKKYRSQIIKRFFIYILIMTNNMKKIKIFYMENQFLKIINKIKGDLHQIFEIKLILIN